MSFPQAYNSVPPKITSLFPYAGSNMHNLKDKTKPFSKWKFKCIKKCISASQMADKPLRPIEKIFLLHVERGDCSTVKRWFTKNIFFV